MILEGLADGWQALCFLRLVLEKRVFVALEFATAQRLLLLRFVISRVKMTDTRRPRMLIVDDRISVRGPMRDFIEATTDYKVCDAVDNNLSVIYYATELHCDLILLHLTTPLQDSLVMLSLLRSKLPDVKIVGLSTLSVDLGNWVSPGIGFDAILTDQDGLSKLVVTLKTLMAESPGAQLRR